MKDYWSCSKFADFIRGTEKPEGGTRQEWNAWDKLAKSLYPTRFWIAETALDAIQDVIYWPIDKLYDIKYYINNRWITRTHQLTAHTKDIVPGQWFDVGSRFMPCLFNTLVDFVEIELAGNSRTIANDFSPPWYAFGWFKFRVWRSPEAGLAYLNWAMNLTMDESWGVAPTSPDYGKPCKQATDAKEIYDLYMWWTTEYVHRLDPMDESGYSNYFEYERAKYGTDWPEQTDHVDRENQKRLSTICRDLEELHRQEDEAMMIRLIRVRDSLWT